MPRRYMGRRPRGYASPVATRADGLYPSGVYTITEYRAVVSDLCCTNTRFLQHENMMHQCNTADPIAVNFEGEKIRWGALSKHHLFGLSGVNDPVTGIYTSVDVLSRSVNLLR